MDHTYDCQACPLSAVRGSLRFHKLLRFKKREIIFEQGDPAFGFYCLCEGAVKLRRRTRNGHRQLLAVLEGPGVLLGAEALIEHHRDYTACALKDSQLYFAAREDFALLPGLELLKMQARLLVQLERRLAETLGLGARQRLVSLLLNGSGNSLLRLGELAALAGLSVEHTCRLLKQLERRGWIRRSSHAIEISNPKALEWLL